jgi:hemoglobin
MASLYERLGAMEAITSVIDAFVARCAGDVRINQKFERSDIPRLKTMRGPGVRGDGRPVHLHRSGHEGDTRGMGVTAGELDALVEDLVATLDDFNVPRAEQEELLGLLGPLREDIVEVESPETGVPLPEAYQAAPALR